MSNCESYCEHGGQCSRGPHDEGEHDSGYCQWTDEHALTKAQADAVLSTKPGGAEFLADDIMLGSLIASMFDEGDDET